MKRIDWKLNPFPKRTFMKQNTQIIQSDQKIWHKSLPSNSPTEKSLLGLDRELSVANRSHPLRD